MNQAAVDLQAALEEALPKLAALSEAEAGRARGAGKWTRQEILGHLIDSALNNLQRFVRAQGVERLVFPGYEQEAWVARQGYRARSWSDVRELWSALNRQVVHVMAAVPADGLGTECVIGDEPPAPLGWWMTDYVRHLRHHLAQIFG